MLPKDSDMQAKNGVQGRRINMEIQMGHSLGADGDWMRKVKACALGGQ